MFRKGNAPPQGTHNGCSDLEVEYEGQAPKQPGAEAESPIDYYSQCRSVIDFVESKADRQRVWRSIAENESAGRTMAQWLALRGRDFNLPTTVSEFERQWRAWARNRPRLRP